MKLSKIDQRAPANVVLMVEFYLKGGRYHTYLGRCTLEHYDAELARYAAAHGKVTATIGWYVEDRKVHKWPTLHKGTQRRFIVSVPFTEGIPDGRIINAIQGVRLSSEAGETPTMNVRAYAAEDEALVRDVKAWKARCERAESYWRRCYNWASAYAPLEARVGPNPNDVQGEVTPLRAALLAITAKPPALEHSIHGPRWRCFYCGHAWVDELGVPDENHAEGCAYVIARDALATP